jgi:hypothetical protein
MNVTNKAGGWTEADNERLKIFVADGVSIIRAAAAFNRKLVSVRTHARKLGTPFPTIRDIRKKFAGDSSLSCRHIRPPQ